MNLFPHFSPPKKLTVSQWADEHRMLSSEASAEPGKYRTSRTPYLREIMDSINDPKIEQIVFMKSSQIGATECLTNCIGYFISEDPCPILVIQPTGAMADTFSKDRIVPLTRDTACLSDKFKDKLRSKGTFSINNTIHHKSFPGGHLTLIGSNSPSQLASRPIRVLLCDEIDRFPNSAKSEGDPVSLAIKRTATFRNKKILLISTPTIKGQSRIESAFNISDQKYFFVPCPHCKHEQKLEWSNVDIPEDNFHKARYKCVACKQPFTDFERWKAIDKGQWKAENSQSNIAGFFINELYSPWTTISKIAQNFLSAKNSPEQLKVFYNTSLGLPFEENLDRVSEDALKERAEILNHNLLPDDIIIITAGVDTQDNRLELSIIGWGIEQESFVLSHKILFGKTSQIDVWESLSNELEKTFTRKDGTILNIAATCIDSGGHSTQNVYDFCQKQQKKGKKVYAIKGINGSQHPIWNNYSRKSKTHKNYSYFMVGVDNAKELVWNRLKLNYPGPRYIHFSSDLDSSYYSQLQSEYPSYILKKGRPVKQWILSPGARNESFDTMVYAICALYSQLSIYEQLCKSGSIKNTLNSIPTKSNYLESRKY